MNGKFLVVGLFFMFCSTSKGQSTVVASANLSKNEMGQLHDSISRISSVFDLKNQMSTKISSFRKGQRDVPEYVERFKISLGSFWTINNTNVQVGISTIERGTELDFENDLGFKKYTTTFLANFQWRCSSRSRFDFSYYSIKRESSRTLDREIVFGEHVYPINFSVKSNFNTEIYRFSYGYAVLSKPKYEVGLLLGAHVVGGDVGISFSGGNAQVSFKDDFNFTAPLPDIGLWGGCEISKRWAVTGEIDYLSLKIGSTKGSVVGGDFYINYRLFNNFDIIAGYTWLDFKVTAEKRNLNGEFLWGYNGPSLALSFCFGKNNWY